MCVVTGTFPSIAYTCQPLSPRADNQGGPATGNRASSAQGEGVGVVGDVDVGG